MPPLNRRRRPRIVEPKGAQHWTPEERAAHDHAELLARPLAELDLPVRVVNVLEERNIILAGQLLQQKRDMLMTIPNFGDTTLREVRAALRAIGLTPPRWDRPSPRRRKPKLRSTHGEAKSPDI